MSYHHDPNVDSEPPRIPIVERGQATPDYLRHIAPELNFRSIAHYISPSGAFCFPNDKPEIFKTTQKAPDAQEPTEIGTLLRDHAGFRRESTAWGDSPRSSAASSRLSARHSHFTRGKAMGQVFASPGHRPRIKRTESQLQKKFSTGPEMLSRLNEVELGEENSERSLNSNVTESTAGTSAVTLEETISQSSIAPFTLTPSRAKSLAWKIRANKQESFKTFSAQSLSYISEKSISSDDKYLQDVTDLKKPKRRNIRANMSCWQLLVYDFNHWFQRQKRKKIDIPLFIDKIRNIEALFGSGIASFFVFTRWVVLLNFIFGFMWLGIVVLPQAVAFDYTKFGETTFYIQNLFDGEDAISISWLFYGGYSRSLGTLQYPLYLAYFWMILMTYFGSLFITFRSIAIARQYNMAYSKGKKAQFSTIIFTSWDYSLQNKEAAGNLCAGICNTLKDLEHESRAKKKDTSRSRTDKLLVICRRILAWCITFSIIGIGCGTIIMLASSDLVAVLKTLGYEDPGSQKFLSVYGTPVAFTLINIIVPPIIYQLPKLENYVSGKDELNVSTGRVFVLRIANIIALVISLHEKVSRGNSKICTGTLLGQELYKLVLLDTIVQFVLQLIPPWVKFRWTKKKEEFKMPKIVLALVYRQALIWAGTLVCPLLPLLGALSMMVVFKVNYAVVTRTCIPPMKRWSQSRHSSFFISLLSATLIILIAFISLIIGSNDIVNLGQVGQKDDETCGPFGGEPAISSFNELRSLYPEEQSMVIVMKAVFSSAVLVPVVFVMLAVVYFQKLNLQYQKVSCNVLSSELEHEREENITMYRKLEEQRDSYKELLNKIN